MADAVQRIVVREAGRPERGALHGEHVRVPDYGGDSLMVSSIVLALPGDGGNWKRGATTLTVVPAGEFGGGQFRVFHEVCNLPKDSRYETEIEIQRMDGARESLRFVSRAWRSPRAAA